MKERVAVMGAGQLGEGVARLASEVGYEVAGFLDDYKDEFVGYPVIGKFSELYRLRAKNITHVVPAFNIPQPERVRLIDQLLEEGFEVPTLVHETVYQGVNNEFGKGTIIFPYTVLWSNIKIGKGCLVKSFSTIGPYVELGNGVNIYPSVTVGARSVVGNNVLFYMHAGCGEGVKIADGCQIYGNSLVLKDIGESNTKWAGVPARQVRSQR